MVKSRTYGHEKRRPFRAGEGKGVCLQTQAVGLCRAGVPLRAWLQVRRIANLFMKTEPEACECIVGLGGARPGAERRSVLRYKKNSFFTTSEAGMLLKTNEA